MSTLDESQSEGYHESDASRPLLNSSQQLLKVRSSGSTVSSQYHDFHFTTFSKPTYCNLCSSFMWGLVNQGLSCLECGYNAHRKCAELVLTPCPAENQAVPTPAAKQDESGPQTISPLKKEHSMIAELLAETQNQSRLLSNSSRNPNLKMFDFMKENTRFLERQGPVIWFNQAMIKLLTWHCTSNTLLFLLFYISICLHPTIILVLPQIIILCLISKFYYIRVDQIMTKKTIPAPHQIGTPPKMSRSAAELKVALQNLQNTMHQLSNIYDAGYNIYRMIDWTNPELTRDILWKVLLSLIVSLAVLYIVPINYIALVGGVGVFLANTAIFKAASLTLAPVITQKIHVVRELIAESKASGNPAVIELVLFENQRWWVGAGWGPVLLKHERSPWSDITGSIRYESKDNLQIEDLTGRNPSEASKGAVDWVETDWELDMKWNKVDENGWEYLNNIWEHSKLSGFLGPFTRRRKWVRHLSFTDKKD